MEDDLPEGEYAPIWEYTDADMVTHEVVVLRQGLLVGTPEGFAPTLAKWEAGGALEHYARHGLVLTDRVASVVEGQGYRLVGQLVVGGVTLKVVFLSGPTWDAWHLQQRVEAQLQHAHDQQGNHAGLS